MEDAEAPDDIGAPRAQWLRGVLDMCLLAVIAEQPVYGYEMTVRLADAGLAVASGSIYPALGRLRSRELVEVFRRPGDGGPDRTYYRLSPRGTEALGAWGQEWRRFAQGVGTLVAGEPDTRQSGADREQ
ncbi:PadR family transcriptional regulator [Kitasatospora paranensis]|uniref:PadR family transcriptional regulator n=1 Tax=Kitasatospora paranensis TaxID=258053 RepID=A0ABW2G1Z0_9ACTN